MGYKDNPFNSDKGKKIMKDIFNLMFISPENKPSKIESDSKQRQISHYKGNIINIVNKMRRFVVGYQQVAISESQSSGILCCPHCGRHDPIWMWETVDAGHYSSPKNWTTSVSLDRWNQGFPTEKGKFLFIVRYRCNTVTSCEDCGVSVKGKYSSCQSCGSNKVKTVGCGEESWMPHYIREYTADDNHPQTLVESVGALARNTTIRVRRDEFAGRLYRYKFVHEQLPDGKVVNSWEDMKRYTPSVEMSYIHKQSGATKTNRYPVSELNYAVSKEEMRICWNGKDTGRGSLYHEGRQYELRDRRTGRPLDACPECGADDYPPLIDRKNVYYRPDRMRIVNPQPLEANTGSGGSFKGLPVYTFYLESTGNPDYKLLLPMPQYHNLRPIPEAPQITQSVSGQESCPNDVGGMAQEETNIAELNEQLIEDYQKKLDANLKSSTDGETNQGYTFVVCEGRSREAYYDFELAKWIDNSPPCYSYRDPTNGSTLKKKREYPRWSQIPSYSPNALPDTDFLQYEGPNLDTHLVQDCVLNKANQALSVQLEGSNNYHSLVKIADRIDEEQGLIFEVFECKTCRGIVEAGGVVPFRRKLGQCDADGKAINDFPQQVLDVEMAYEKSFPTKDVYGNPVPTAWGLIADSEHNGKKMLENPDLNIRIG